MIRLRRMSIRFRLVAGSAALAAVVLSVLAVLTAMQVRDAATRAATQLAENDLRSYAVDLRTDPEERPDLPASGLLVLVIAPNGAVVRSSMPPALAAAARTIAATGTTTTADGRFQVVARTVANEAGTWRLWAARDVTASDALLRGVLMTVIIGTPIGVLATAAIAWIVTTGALRPVQRLRDSAERLRAPGADGTLPVRGGHELADLAATLNALIADLRASAARERRVTADAAHELRTPLAVLAAQVELASRDQASADLSAIGASVARLTGLADTLLALSRADSLDSGPLGHAFVADLVTEAMRAVDDARLLAPPGVLVDLALAGGLDEAAGVPIDVGSFGRILVNLVGNALHAGPSSAVSVSMRTEDGAMVLQVADDGSGLPEEFLPFAFDRFARPTGASSSGSTGAGLGLALVRRLAERAGGTAELVNRSTGGALATVRLPLDGGRPPS